MNPRRSVSVARALQLVLEGYSLSEAARMAGCNVRSVRRALRQDELAAIQGGIKNVKS